MSHVACRMSKTELFEREAFSLLSVRDNGGPVFVRQLSTFNIDNNTADFFCISRPSPYVFFDSDGLCFQYFPVPGTVVETSVDPENGGNPCGISHCQLPTDHVQKMRPGGRLFSSRSYGEHVTMQLGN